MDHDERKSFLDDRGYDSDGSTVHERPPRPSRNTTVTILIVLNGVLLLVCVLLSIAVLTLSGITGIGSLFSSVALASDGTKDLADPYSPANSAIEYEYRSVVRNDTRFLGEPGALWEKSLHELMEGTLIRVSKEELDLYGEQSIPLRGGGYAAGTGLAHNLHCYKKIKKFLYKDQFYSHLDPEGEELAYIRNHADHCLDWLRQSVLCNIDYTMYTLYWGEHGLQQDPPIPTHSVPGQRKCVNWDKLHEWMLSRAATTDEFIVP